MKKKGCCIDPPSENNPKVSSIYLKIGFFAKLTSPGVGEVIIGERYVERWNQVEKSFPGDDIAQHWVRRRVAPPWAVKMASVLILRWPWCLVLVQIWRRSSSDKEALSWGAQSFERTACPIPALVQGFLGADHFAGVAFNSGEDLGVSGFEGEGRVDGLKPGALEQLHFWRLMSVYW